MAYEREVKVGDRLLFFDNYIRRTSVAIVEVTRVMPATFEVESIKGHCPRETLKIRPPWPDWCFFDEGDAAVEQLYNHYLHQQVLEKEYDDYVRGVREMKTALTEAQGWRR